MKREEIGLIAHLLTSMKEILIKLEVALKKKDNGEIITAKREILKIQNELRKTL